MALLPSFVEGSLASMPSGEFQTRTKRKSDSDFRVLHVPLAQQRAARRRPRLFHLPRDLERFEAAVPQLLVLHVRAHRGQHGPQLGQAGGVVQDARPRRQRCHDAALAAAERAGALVEVCAGQHRLRQGLPGLAKLEISFKRHFKDLFIPNFRNELNLCQVVLEGVWGNNRVSGYIAVDDITVFEGNCDSKYRRPILRKPPRGKWDCQMLQG